MLSDILGADLPPIAGVHCAEEVIRGIDGNDITPLRAPVRPT
jgi:hypothetical protein